MKTIIKKSMKSIILLTILLFALGASFGSIVSADPIGIGKFVDVKVIAAGVIGGGGSVTVVKVSSGETWETGTEGKLNEKLGAGLVEIVANDDGNFIIDSWKVGYEVDELGYITGDYQEYANLPVIDFRTKKGTTYVEAYFTELFTVNIMVAEAAPDGYIKYSGQVFTDLSLTVGSGTPLSFEFIANEGYHLSALSENFAFIYPETLYEITVNQNFDVVVYFSEDGYAYVPAGTNVEVFFTEDVSLTFGNTDGGFVSSGFEIIRSASWGLFIWDITDVSIVEDGTVFITLIFEGDVTNLLQNIQICHDVDQFYCDVDNDDVITAADLSLVAQYNKAMNNFPNEFPYVELYDTNRDGEITQDDVHRVNEYKGTTVAYEDPISVLIDIVDGNTIVIIETDEFSIFRGR